MKTTPTLKKASLLKKLRWLTLMFACLLTIGANATVRYVWSGSPSTNPNPSGLGWTDAFKDLQAAIYYSSAGDEIWIATGTYYPGSGSSFSMKNGVKIYGGFVAGMDALNQRNWRTYPVVLNGNNGRVVNNVNLNSSAMLDGVIILGGQAVDGAGMLNNSSSPTISNVIFDNNNASGYGGGMHNNTNDLFTYSSPGLTNVEFKNNKAKYGAGLYTYGGTSTLTNVVFTDNLAFEGGGGMLSERAQTTIINSVFYVNKVANGPGAGLLNSLSTTDLRNCTFYGNYFTTPNTSGDNGKGAAIYNSTNSSYTGASAFITNCLFRGNVSAVPANYIYSTYTPAVPQNNIFINYSFTQTLVTRGGDNNVLGTVSPFVSETDGDGADNFWMTADDGLQLSLCNGAVAIDKATTAGIYETNDITGASRRVDVLIVPNGNAGFIDMGAYENRTTATPEQLSGTIGTSHAVPVPQELLRDYVTSVTSPAATTFSWQQSNDGATWSSATATSPADSAGYRLPVLTTNTFPAYRYYRRIAKSAAYCNTDYISNIVRIKMVKPNGQIIGRVISTNGVGVLGITVKANHAGKPVVLGADTNYVYTALTDQGGYYTISNIFYGDPDSTAAKDTFKVMAVKTAHGFNPGFFNKVLSQTIPQPASPVDFTDTTVFSVTGQTFQRCTDCVSLSGTTETQNCPIDSVPIWKGTGPNSMSFYSYTAFADGVYGRYGIAVSDPGTLRIEPRLTGHNFSPAFLQQNVTSDITGQDFQDVTTHTITGKFTAGCGEYIGTAVLEFTDVLPDDASGNPRASCFRKRVTTAAATGSFSITLPARRYTVRVVSFTSSSASGNPAYIFSTDLINFFNNQLPKDSLVKDVSRFDAVLNLEYARPPVLKIMSGLDSLCGGTNRGYALMQQTVTDSFTIKVFQGVPTLNNGNGCPVKDTSNIQVFTNISSNDNVNQPVINVKPADAGTIVKLQGGTPNIISPYYKTLNIQFTDKYNRQATAINKNVIVTGVKADAATFTTVSPEIPMLILHDPPGDKSYSFWQSNQSLQSAFRMYTASNNSNNIWGEVKIGVKLSTGLFVSTTSEIWGTIGGSINVGSTNTNSNETILTTTTSQYLSTSDDGSITSADGDLYVGAALNLIYAPSTEITYNNCQITTSRKLMVANDGFATQYIYTEKHIREVVIPTLNQLVLNPGNTPTQTANYQNQVKVWQQVLNNNAINKARAAFDKNISFDGSAGPITNATTTSVSKSSTVEFAMNIDKEVAIALGLEVAGSGLSGGIDLMFKTETGQSTTTNTTQETTTGYTLDDDDNGDQFSVNIKKDPVYSTPVFELAAGTASCPPEATAQPRDEMQLTIPVPSVSGIPETGEAQFVLKIGNTSPSGEARTYLLSFDQASNPNAAIVTIGGSPVLTPISYSIGYLGEVQVTVTVKKAASSTVFSYEGLKFTVTDACGGDVSQSGIISAYFTSQCSAVTLAQPENGWIMNASANNLLPVLIKDYTITKLTGITLEYSVAGNSNWVSAFSQTTAQLNPNGTTGTIVNWNINGIADGAYNLRLKLDCTQGVVYSQRASGIIDRTAPKLFGKPEPTDDGYVNGDVIAFNYNENLRTNTDSIQVTMRRLSNNQLIPVTVSSFENRMIITPNSSIAGFTGDSIRLIVNRVADQYGNQKITPDTIRFVVGTSTPATGTNALTVSITNPVVYKNSDSTINMFFNLPVNVTHDTRINYSIGGTARLGVDYNIVYTAPQPAYAYFNGAQGALRITQNTRQAVLKIVPIGDTALSADKTIIISMSEGGDYNLGTITTVTGTLTSEDGVNVYTFTGNGNFNIKNNWLNGKMPLTTLAAGKEIIIDPSGICTLNVKQTIKPGAKLTVKQNKQFIIQGSLRQQ